MSVHDGKNGASVFSGEVKNGKDTGALSFAADATGQGLASISMFATSGSMVSTTNHQIADGARVTISKAGIS